MTTNNDFNGYSLFNDIGDKDIRAWNRANAIYNIKERHGKEVATKYTTRFDKPDQTDIFRIMMEVASDGYANVRRRIFREYPMGSGVIN